MFFPYTDHCWCYFFTMDANIEIDISPGKLKSYI